jgi:hypothetical protein
VLSVPDAQSALAGHFLMLTFEEIHVRVQRCHPGPENSIRSKPFPNGSAMLPKRP